MEICLSSYIHLTTQPPLFQKNMPCIRAEWPTNAYSIHSAIPAEQKTVSLHLGTKYLKREKSICLMGFIMAHRNVQLQKTLANALQKQMCFTTQRNTFPDAQCMAYLGVSKNWGTKMDGL